MQGFPVSSWTSAVPTDPNGHHLNPGAAPPSTPGVSHGSGSYGHVMPQYHEPNTFDQWSDPSQQQWQWTPPPPQQQQWHDESGYAHGYSPLPHGPPPPPPTPPTHQSGDYRSPWHGGQQRSPWSHNAHWQQQQQALWQPQPSPALAAATAAEAELARQRATTESLRLKLEEARMRHELNEHLAITANGASGPGGGK